MKALIVPESTINEGRNPEFYPQRNDFFVIKSWNCKDDIELRQLASLLMQRYPGGDIEDCDLAEFTNDKIVVVSEISERYLNLVCNNGFYLWGDIDGNSVFHIFNNKTKKRMTEFELIELEQLFSE